MGEVPSEYWGETPAHCRSLWYVRKTLQSHAPCNAPGHDDHGGRIKRCAHAGGVANGQEGFMPHMQGRGSLGA
eukprot:CAMPEP_0195144566 /NCGR_PEP_ID=MMETSP0448-20130528/168330_1 /TAXON_ID=66468 /ORGANISM="Heterocapsa triquestra, Strain CCMP 448" /LENGTH=72 /DNA_ID=CAMNT_0040183049 /DNA_START=164 /DNA_END=379 /DNA_ORIENTATION=+